MQPYPTSVAPRDLESASHPVVVVRDGLVVQASEPALAALGEDVVGTKFLDLVYSADRRAVEDRLGSRNPAPPSRTTLMTVDGERLVDASWIPVIEDGSGATLITWRNVTTTERIPAWLSAITDSSMDLIGITDLRGNLLYMNDALLRLRGDDSRDGLPDGRNAIDHAAPGQSEIIETLLEDLEKHGHWRGELMFQGVGGIVPVDAVIERSEVAGEVVYSLIGRDISRELELRDELQDALDTRDSFVTHVAHEIKNPLSGIVGMALVLRDETDLSPAQREMIELLIAGATDVERIVEDLAALSSDGSSPIRIVTDPVYLEAAARTVIETLEAGRDVSIELSGNAVCVGDEVRIRQVLRNLLMNAVRYGGPDVRVRISTRRDRARVEVSDDGDGVPPEFAEAIFENFSSAHDTIEDSMGVGLAVSRQLTIGMGGSLSYTRKDGRTRFTMDLPAAPSS